MLNFMLIGARVCEPRRVKVEGLPSETYMAYNTLHCTNVHACDENERVIRLSISSYFLPEAVAVLWLYN